MWSADATTQKSPSFVASQKARHIKAERTAGDGQSVISIFITIESTCNGAAVDRYSADGSIDRISCARDRAAVDGYGTIIIIINKAD